MDKFKLRKKLLKKRDDLLDRKKEDKAKEVFLDSPEYKNAKNLMVYSAIGTELDLGSLMEKALKDGKELYFPKTDKNDKSMKAIRVNNLKADLKEGNYGILEPVSNETIRPSDLDLIIVPGLSFTKKGERLGYGAGFYDRYLPKTKALKVTIINKDMLSNELPVEPHDQNLDKIYTQDGVINCY